MVLGNEAATYLKGKEAVTSEFEKTKSGKNTTIITEYHVEVANKSSTAITARTIDDQAKNIKLTSASSDEGQRKLSVLILLVLIVDDNFSLK